MRILLISYRFRPDIGGIETVTALLASEFALAGHSVTVVTFSAADLSVQGDKDSFAVLRQPTLFQYMRALFACDVVLQNNFNIRFGWPLLVGFRRWIVVHHIEERSVGEVSNWKYLIKTHAYSYARNIAVSTALSTRVPVPCQVVSNPYDAKLFASTRSWDSREGVIFVGRLVQDKGLRLLIKAIKLLESQGSPVRLTVVGDGPDRPDCVEIVKESGLDSLVTFTGMLAGLELARLFNAHKVLVVPSYESFGIVALEGLACGCIVIGSNEGGLPEAIGPGGVTYTPGDHNALSAAILAAVGRPNLTDDESSAVAAHLRGHEPSAIAKAYLDIMYAISKE